MKTRDKRREGSAILTVLGIVAVVSMVCVMLSYAANQQTHSSQITRDMLKARMIAESGLNRAYHAVKEDFSLAKTYRSVESFGGGRYEVRAVTLPNAPANRAQLSAVGISGLGKAVVAVDLEERARLTSGSGGSDTYFNLLYDLLVGGTMTLKGNFHAGVADIHANGNADLSGSASVNPNTTVSSAKTVEWKKAPNDVVLLSNQSPVEILGAALADAIEMFKEHARQNDAVYANAAQIPAAPPGGVAYCTGSTDGWSRQGTGCFIFEGAATLQGQSVNLVSVNNYPALIVLSTGEMRLNAGSVVNGAILVPNGSVRLNGHSVIYGPVLVGQSIRGNGTADLYAGSGQGFNLPPTTARTSDVVITAWH